MLATAFGLVLYFVFNVPLFGWAVGGHRFFRGGLLLATISSLVAALATQVIGASSVLVGVTLGLTLFVAATLTLVGLITALLRLLAP